MGCTAKIRKKKKETIGNCWKRGITQPRKSDLPHPSDEGSGRGPEKTDKKNHGGADGGNPRPFCRQVGVGALEDCVCVCVCVVVVVVVVVERCYRAGVMSTPNAEKHKTSEKESRDIRAARRN